MYKKYIKRLLDVLISISAILILSPVLLTVAILVRIKLGSPVLFKQQRPGKGGSVFTLYKFRTMKNATDENGVLLPDEIRLTRFGLWLRSTSLDELPELFNILKADMSFVGPRPLLVEYLPLYNSRQQRRHEVQPGLSGLAQINGRNAISWEDKFEYDVTYIERISFALDMKIFFKTIKKALIKEGISQHGVVTMLPFAGGAEEVAAEYSNSMAGVSGR